MTNKHDDDDFEGVEYGGSSSMFMFQIWLCILVVVLGLSFGLSKSCKFSTMPVVTNQNK